MSEQRDIAVRIIEASREDQRFHPYKRPAGYDKFASTQQMSENRQILMAFVVVSKRQIPDSWTISAEIAPYSASSMGEWSEQQAKYHCVLSREAYLYLDRRARRYHPYKRPRQYFRRQRRSDVLLYMNTSYFSSAVRQNLGMTNTTGSDNTVDHVTHLVQTTVLPEYDTNTFTGVSNVHNQTGMSVNDDLSGFGITRLSASDISLKRELEMGSETSVVNLDSIVQSKSDYGSNFSESAINHLLYVLKTSSTNKENTNSRATTSTVTEKDTGVNLLGEHPVTASDVETEVYPPIITVLEQANIVTVTDMDKEDHPSINTALEQECTGVNPSSVSDEANEDHLSIVEKYLCVKPVTVLDEENATNHAIHSELDEENALLGTCSYADLSLSESAINILLGIEETPSGKCMKPSDEISTSFQVSSENKAQPLNNKASKNMSASDREKGVSDGVMPVIVTEKRSDVCAKVIDNRQEVDKVSVEYQELTNTRKVFTDPCDEKQLTSTAEVSICSEKMETQLTEEGKESGQRNKEGSVLSEDEDQHEFSKDFESVETSKLLTKLHKAELDIVEDRKVEHNATTPNEKANMSVSTLCYRGDESSPVATTSEKKHIENASAVDVPTIEAKTNGEIRFEVDDSLFIREKAMVYTNPAMRSYISVTINCGGRQYENIDAQVSILQTKTIPTVKNAEAGSQDLNKTSKSGINGFVKRRKEITEKKATRLPNNGKLNQHGVSKELDISKNNVVNTESIEVNQRLCLKVESVSRTCTDDKKTEPKASIPFSRPPTKTVYTPAQLSSNRVMCFNPDEKYMGKRQQENSGRTTFSTNEQRVSKDIASSTLKKREFCPTRQHSTNASDVHAHMKPVSKMVKIKLNDTNRKIFKPSTGGRSKDVGMFNSFVNPKGIRGITPKRDNNNTSQEKRLELRKRRFQSSLDTQTIVQEAPKKKFVFNRITF